MKIIQILGNGNGEQNEFQENLKEENPLMDSDSEEENPDWNRLGSYIPNPDNPYEFEQ